MNNESMEARALGLHSQAKRLRSTQRTFEDRLTFLDEKVKEKPGNGYILAEISATKHAIELIEEERARVRVMLSRLKDVDLEAQRALEDKAGVQ